MSALFGKLISIITAAVMAVSCVCSGGGSKPCDTNTECNSEKISVCDVVSCPPETVDSIAPVCNNANNGCRQSCQKAPETECKVNCEEKQSAPKEEIPDISTTAEADKTAECENGESNICNNEEKECNTCPDKKTVITANELISRIFANYGITRKADTETASQSKTEQNKTDIAESEREVVRLVNEIRANYGLKPLELNEELCTLARLKSDDMCKNRYFDHTSPTYGSAFDMMKSKGIKYRTAGENIAMGYPSAQSVVSGWMNSAGHRANILNASYTQIGVGYCKNGNYWTQMFMG